MGYSHAESREKASSSVWMVGTGSAVSSFSIVGSITITTGGTITRATLLIARAHHSIVISISGAGSSVCVYACVSELVCVCVRACVSELVYVCAPVCMQV